MELTVKLAKAFADIDSSDKEPAETTIKGFMPIGSVGGSGRVEVNALEIVVPARQLVYHGIRFEVTSGGDYPSSGVATVDLSDVEKLTASLDELANVKIATSRFALSEVSFEMGDLRVVVFNTDNVRSHALVAVGGSTCHLVKQLELLDLRKLVSLAAEHLQSAITWEVPRLGYSVANPLRSR